MQLLQNEQETVDMKVSNKNERKLIKKELQFNNLNYKVLEFHMNTDKNNTMK